MVDHQNFGRNKVSSPSAGLSAMSSAGRLVCDGNFSSFALPCERAQ